MAPPPDPPSSGPRPEPRLVALHRERQLARDHLADGYGNGYLEATELERRLDLAERATSVAELRALTEDLVLHEPPPQQLERAATALATLPAEMAPAELRLSAMFSESRHNGRWTPGRVTHVRSLFASMKLDLREARLTPGVTEFRLAVTFAELEIIVPPEVAVQVSCGVMFAEVRQDGNGGADDHPEAPRLVLTGKVLFGAVRVRHRLPGEGWWGATKRQLLGPTPTARKRLPPGDGGGR